MTSSIIPDDGLPATGYADSITFADRLTAAVCAAGFEIAGR